MTFKWTLLNSIYSTNSSSLHANHVVTHFPANFVYILSRRNGEDDVYQFVSERLNDLHDLDVYFALPSNRPNRLFL